MPGLKERAKTLVELIDERRLPLRRAAAADGREGRAILADGGRARRSPTCVPQFEAVDGLVGRRTRRRACAAYAETAGLKLGKVAQPLRAALTGRTISPGMFDVLEVLGQGRNRSARLARSAPA